MQLEAAEHSSRKEGAMQEKRAPKNQQKAPLELFLTCVHNKTPKDYEKNDQEALS